MPLDMLLGAALVVTGMGLGKFWPARRKGPKPKLSPAPICGCSCDLALHEPDGEGGGTTCHGQIRREHYDSLGNRNGYEWVRCACRQYSGPKMLDPGYVARELTDGTR